MPYLGTILMALLGFAAVLVLRRIPETLERAVNALGTVAERIAEASALVAQTDAGALAQRVGEAEATLLSLRRVVTDLDESVEHRMRKLAARDRRAAAEAVPPADGEDPAQLSAFGAQHHPRVPAAAGGHHPTRPFGASNGRAFGAAR